jgi:hypothetical protein
MSFNDVVIKYSLRILIIDTVNFLHNIWPFVLFKIFLEKSYILLWFILLLKELKIYHIILNI